MENDLSIDCSIHPHISVMCNGIPKLQDDTDLEKMKNLWQARNDFVKRNDITYYITDEDLLKIQDTKTQIRLLPESIPKKRHTKENSRGSRIHIKHNIMGSMSDQHIELKRKESKRKNSVSNKENDILEAKINPRRIKRTISIFNDMYNVTYIHDVNIYYLYVLEKVDGIIYCHGITDSDIKYKDIEKLTDVITVRNENSDTNVVIISKDIISMEFPIYFSISSDNTKLNIEQFLDIVSGLLHTAREQVLKQSKDIPKTI